MEKKPRPKSVPTVSYRMNTGCGNIYIRVGFDGKDFLEVFATLGKAGGCASCNLEGLTRSTSLGLRYGIPPMEYIEELKEIKCPLPSWDNGEQILSCPDAIAKVLLKEVTSGSKIQEGPPICTSTYDG